MSGESGRLWRRIRGLRVRQKGAVAYGLFYLALAAVPLVLGHTPVVSAVFAANAVAWGVTSLREPRPPADDFGSGPLAPSGTGRFRAGGWPPSKDLDTYR